MGEMVNFWCIQKSTFGLIRYHADSATSHDGTPQKPGNEPANAVNQGGDEAAAQGQEDTGRCVGGSLQ